MRYEWILFDADGTLFDYDRAEASALARTFEQSGLPLRPGAAEAYRRINAGIWRQFEQGQIDQQRLRARRFELLFEELGLKHDAEAFSARYLENLAHGIDLLDGAERVLQALDGRVGLALITNGLHEVQRPRLARSTIGHYFSEVIISEEVGAAKPDARIFDVALESMGSPPRDKVLIVGDSLSSDIQGGSDYGLGTCWYNPGRSPRPDGLRIDYEITDLEQLLSLVGPGQAPDVYPMPAFPTLAAADLVASKVFYVEALGFQAIYSFAPAGGPALLEHLRWARYADLFLVPGGLDEGPKGRGVQLNFSAALAGRTCAEIAEQARAYGAQVEGPIERSYNAREVVVTDPDGFVLVFTEPMDLGKTFDEVMADAEPPA
ncbi:MAG: YjjG family noncanonical pyrimidine nucleotidase [Anaerolineae bacterium]